MLGPSSWWVPRWGSDSTLGVAHASQPSQHVLIVSERPQRTGQQLAEELELMGFSVSRLPGDEDAAEDALGRSDLAAVVFLPDDEGADVRVWVLEGEPGDAQDAPEPIELDVTDGGTRETFALRAAELLRGRLMPIAPDGSPREDDDESVTSASGADADRFSITVGPALIASSYASTSFALSADVAFALAPRWTLGPYFLGSLDRSAWRADPERFSMRQIGGGAKVRYALTVPASAIQAHLLGRAGLRSLSLRTESGRPDDRTTGSVSGPTFGLGVEGSYALSRRLRLGADMTFVAGFPVWDSFTTNPDLSPGQRRQAEAARPGPGPDFQWVTSLLLSAHW